LPASSPASTLDEINLRFVRGRPSNSLADAGVVVRQRDAMTRWRSKVSDLWSVGDWDRTLHSISATFIFDGGHFSEGA
jgi:hypothetical protein